LLIEAGEKERSVSLDIKQKPTREYCQSFRELVSSKKIEAKGEELAGDEKSKSRGEGARLYVVKRVGQHFQNDLHWKNNA